MKPTILILGARAPIALEMARSFHGYGCRVIMGDSLSWTLGRWSNSVSRYVRLTPPAENENRFIREIRDLVRAESIDHVIPTCEEAIYVSRGLSEIPCSVWTSPFALLQTLHNKLEFAKMASTHFSVPETVVADEFQDWSNSRDYVFKKIYSRFATSAIIGKEIAHLDEVLADKSKWVAQKLIKGTEVCVYSIWEHGVMKAYAAYHPVYRVGQGSGIFFKPWVDESLVGQVESFGKALHYHGQLSFDFIHNDAGNFVLECNPRGTSGAHLLNAQLASCFLGDNRVIIADRKEYSIKWAMTALAPFSILSAAFHRSSDVIWDWRDPAPFLLQPLSLLEISYIKFRDHKTWLNATTGDIEWNGCN